MFFLISARFPCLSCSLISRHLATSSLIILLSLTLFSIPLFNHSFLPVFNQHPLNFNIQAHVLPHSGSISLHSLVSDSTYNITIKRNNISHQPPSSPIFSHLSFPIFPYSPCRATFKTILPNQHLINSLRNECLGT